MEGSDRRRLDRSRGMPLRRTHGQLVHTLIDRRNDRLQGFDVAGALELYFDRFPTREAQLVLLRSWLYAVERGELSNRDAYERSHACDRGHVDGGGYSDGDRVLQRSAR